MPYITLQDLDLKIDFIARDLTIINFNNSMQKLETFVNALNGNVQTIEEQITYSDEYPDAGTGVDGDTWIVLE